MRGLVIGVQPIEQILEGLKTWEIRGKKTEMRGTIALIKKGTKTVVGTADLVAVHGPLSLSDQRAHADKHLPTDHEWLNGCGYKRTYAWELRNVRRFQQPIPYKHPSGAVTWVVLADDFLSGRA